MTARTQQISERLQALLPTHLEIQDESAQHIGHVGNTTGASHIALTIVSESFRDLSSLKRHQLVYQQLKDLIPQEIHAIRIQAHTPEEMQR